MGKIIAICNQKGGVGKTTTAINLSSSLVEKGKTVLLIDIDPQGNSTKGVGIDKDIISKSIYDVLLLKENAADVILNTQFGIDLIPATIDLAMADFDLATSDEKKHYHLKNQLDGIKANYDFIIIDCPPSLGLLNMNALVASDSVIVPVQCEYYALDGLISLLTTIRKIQSGLNKELNIEGVLITMYDSRTKLHNEVSMDIRKFFKESVYEISIPRSIKFPTSQSKGKPILYYDRMSNATKSYLELADEVINNKNGNKRKTRSK